jgi:energy-coupling factor transporter ATP-binding protein EcfA2
MKKQMMKTLCRIRLINWHYFVNETINIKGSVLISGENTSGKSTVLDAIQLVLTTNTRKFNTAANEKSKRDLKGYVRCKTGNEDSTYIRKGSVITYVALEFYEEKTSKHFTLGVKIDSPDEESSLIIRWFREECRLEELTFLTGGRTSTSEEFRKNDRKVQLITQTSEAKLRFGQRLGNLEDRFFDMIPKSLAFKPMDNVKDFINKFILSESKIEVASLRNNIGVLKELEDLMDVTKLKVSELKDILSKHNEIVLKDKEIIINDILIKKAEIEALKIDYETLIQNNLLSGQNLVIMQKKKNDCKFSLDNERNRLNDLILSINQNETTMLINQTKHRIELLKVKAEELNKAVKNLDNMIIIINESLNVLYKQEIVIVKKEEIYNLSEPEAALDQKLNLIYKLEKEFDKFYNKFYSEYIKSKGLIENYENEKIKLGKEIKDLENKKLIYPPNTNKLKEAIEKEFIKLGIKSEVRIFSDLLEISDIKWQNAIEGYLNTQRFYLIVEPQYHKIALDVYDRIKNEVHTVGLVNTGKIDTQKQANLNSLAYLIKSENRYARAYAVYLLNKVIRCENVHELKEHKIAITPDCMLYQNFAERKIDSDIYRTPYIGANAYIIQLDIKRKELERLNENLKTVNSKLITYKDLTDKLNKCNFITLKDNINAPLELKNNKEQIVNEKIELKKAESDPSYIQIQLLIEECKKTVDEKDKEMLAIVNNLGQLEQKIKLNNTLIEDKKKEVNKQEAIFNNLCEKYTEESQLGINKYNEQVKLKEPAVIVKNFSPKRTEIFNKKNDLNIELIKLQNKFCSKYKCDLGSGYEQIKEYVDELYKLVSSDIIKYDEDLKKAKENCELEFRESFLARLKENIENAKQEFKNLNNALKNIYYGEDSYKFEITFDKKKESIYKMIISKNNFEGYNLLSESFHEEYKEEIEDLFSKLTAYDDQGEKVLAEYTDYRSYLDYDIIVEKKDGKLQKFSKIYGEKSGGETQTPYYVAIAASFVQLYKLGDTIRIIMLDEAFDKMDDNRISSMMDFLNCQDFQIIIATPPAKIEVIGEKVDTILLAMREGTSSIIEEYDL